MPVNLATSHGFDSVFSGRIQISSQASNSLSDQQDEWGDAQAVQLVYCLLCGIIGEPHSYDGIKSGFNYFFVIVPREPCRLLYSASSDGEHIISTSSELAGFRRKRNLSRALHDCV
jgi:hypothetical protein